MKIARSKRKDRRAAEPVEPARTGRAQKFLLGKPMVILLLAVHWTLAVSSVYDKSPTFDEPIHLTGGFSYWKLSDYRINAEAGVLSQRLAAIPLLLGQYNFPTSQPAYQAAWQRGNGWMIAYGFFYDCGNDPQSMLFTARAFMALMSVVMGLVIFLWSRQFFGVAGGMFSLALFALSPAFLAYGPLAATDVVSSLCFLLAMGAFWRMLHLLSLRRLLASGAALGLLFLSKMSAPVVLPMLAVLLVLRVVRGGPLEVTVGENKTTLEGRLGVGGALVTASLVNAVIVLVMIWSAYSMRYSAFSDESTFGNHLDQERMMSEPGRVQDIARFLGKYRLIPQAYLYGTVFTAEYSAQRGAFMNGEHYLTGRKSFFPYAFAVKTPLSALAVIPLALLAGVGSIRGRPVSERRKAVREGLYNTAPLWVLMLGFWILVVNSHINIGLRHLLPAYAPMLILAGVCGRWLVSKVRWVQLATAGLLAAALVECLLAWPNYLAYFNVFVGGNNAYKHLIDSSLDWGQDLPALKQWLLDHQGETGGQPVYVGYFGTGNPSWYGLVYGNPPGTILDPLVYVQRLPGFFDMDLKGQPTALSLKGGTYCINATLFQQINSQAPGPWVEAYEKEYQALAADVGDLLQQPPDEIRKAVQANPKLWPRIQKFMTLRMGRLCAYLQGRQPDANVNYTFLIFRLSDNEVREALQVPPPQAVKVLPNSASPYVNADAK